jgi:hypothetical protein
MSVGPAPLIPLGRKPALKGCSLRAGSPYRHLCDVDYQLIKVRARNQLYLDYLRTVPLDRLHLRATADVRGP